MTQRLRRFSIARFTLLCLLQLGLLFAGYRALLPTLWARQLAGGVLPFLSVFLAIHLLLCVFEWAFHRYVLHAVTSRTFKGFAHEHRHHHSLTAVRLRPVEKGSDRFVLNEYPITHEEQYPSSA